MATLERTDELYTNLSARLLSAQNSLQDRYRALFTLKALGDSRSIDIISECFKDESVLLKHELAYVLGQMRNPYAVPLLAEILNDDQQDVMVRHEAGEALGAIGAAEALPILEPYLSCPIQELRETCFLSYERLQRLYNPNSPDYTALNSGPRDDLPFVSVDPAVGTLPTDNISELSERLLNHPCLYERYRAMFTLRDMNCEASVMALCHGLSDSSSALFRHEIAYVLGQLAHPSSIPSLAAALQNPHEHPMVRHECAEALGAVATSDANDVLEKFLNDKSAVVRESVIIALDILEYEQNTCEFQYASIKTMKESI